jgi:internalin A
MQALLQIAECLRTQNTVLNLGNCGLTDADMSIGMRVYVQLQQCTHLETLILSNKKTDWDTKMWLSNENNAAKNCFTALPPAIMYLLELKTLSISGYFDDYWRISKNKLQSIEGLDTLTQLTTVNISANKIKDICPLKPLMLRPINPLTIVWKFRYYKQEIAVQNPIKMPPMKIVKQGNVAILDWISNDCK